MASSKPATIGILSVGDMGMGIAKLLAANGFSVATNCKGRSPETVERVKAANVANICSDTALVKQCDLILSVVPPRDAEATAQRIVDALALVNKDAPLYFADMNAVAPSSIKVIARTIERAGVPIRLIDGSILGGPPHATEPKESDGALTWYLPLMPTSGPYGFADILGYGEKLSTTFNTRHISADIGAASGLKMCFASMTKGYTAIATQAFTTAHRLGVVDPLKDAMMEILGPARFQMTDCGLSAMVPKAYRWVREMEEIATTFSEEGGFDPDIFRGAAGVYKAVAEDSVLGQEKIGKRKRGANADDVAAALAEGFEKKRKKTD